MKSTTKIDNNSIIKNSNAKKCYKCKSSNNTFDYLCKTCRQEYNLSKYRSLQGKIDSIYRSQVRKSKKRKHKPPTYTKQEFIDYCLTSNKFIELYNNWVESGYKTELSPSIDRPNDYDNYNFDNIQVMTWKENNDKGNKDIRKGKNNKVSKAVMQFDLNSNFIKEFYSLSQAYRDTNTNQSNIVKCCSKQRKTAGGFIWKYAT